jgi:hypothetical protein
LFGGFEGPPLTLPKLLTDIVSKKMNESKNNRNLIKERSRRREKTEKKLRQY